MRMKSHLLQFASTAALSAAIVVGVTHPAAAQPQSTAAAGSDDPAQPNGATTLESLVVTATKRAERIQDIPMTVDAVTGARLQELGEVHSGGDLVQFLPGVTFINSASTTTSELNIRGAGQARLPNSDAAIGLFRNDAYIAGGNLGGRTFQRFDLFDLDNVQVLKGPQGALYGRNAVTGAVNVISAKPTWTSGGWVEGLYGSKDRAGFEGVYNMPVNDVFALRFGVDSTFQDGCDYRYISSSVNFGCFDMTHYGAGRVSARYKPNSKFDATLVVDYSNGEEDTGITQFRDPVSRDLVESSSPLPNSTSSRQWNIGLNASYDLGWSKLVSTTNYRSRKSNLFADPDALTTNTEQSSYYDDANTFYQEVRLQGQAPRLKWLVGADLFLLSDDYADKETGYPIVAASMGRAAQDPNILEDTRSNQHSYGLYGSLNYDLTSRLSVEGQVRYSIDAKSANIKDIVIATRAPQYAAFPPGSPQADPHRSFYNTTGDLTVSYRVSHDVLAYTRIGNAYRAGGFNVQLGVPCSSVVGPVPGTNCNTLDPPLSYDPEHSITYEVGLKTAWFDRMLVVNVNVYDVEFSDILANLNNGLQPMQNPLLGAMFLNNAGDASEFGYEIEVDYSPKLPAGWGSLEINGILGHQEGKFDDVPAFLLATVPNGSHLARLRPFETQGNIIYHHRAFADWRWTAVTSWNSENGGFQEAANTLKLGSFTTWNARVALSNGRLEFAIKAQNLFDKDYYVNQATVIGAGLGSTYVPGRRRYVEGSLTYRF